MTNKAVAGFPISRQNKGEFVTEGSFAKAPKELFQIKRGRQKGSQSVQCTADMVIDKRDKPDVFKTWEMTYGTRVYKSLTDRKFVSLAEASTKVTIRKPDYENAEKIPSDEDMKKLEDPSLIEDADKVRQIKNFQMKSHKIDISTSKHPVGDKPITGDWTQSVYVGNLMARNPLEPSSVSIVFEADIPRAMVQENSAIMQYVILTGSNPSGQHTVLCLSVVAVPLKKKAGWYTGDVSIKAAGRAPAGFLPLVKSDLSTTVTA